MSLLNRIQKGGGGAGSTPPGGGDNNIPPSQGGMSAADESRLAAIRAQRVTQSRAPGRSGDSAYVDLKTRVQTRLLQELDQSMDLSRKTEVRAHIQ